MSVQENIILNKLRQKLNGDKVKLWLSPYTTEDGEKGDVPNDLINKYSQELHLTCKDVENAIEHLRLHALDKLSAKKRFTESSVATLKIRLAGNVTDVVKQHYPDLMVMVHLSLISSGAELKANIADKTTIEAIKLKLISHGKLLDDDLTLDQQGIKNLDTVLSLVLNDTEAEARRQQNQILNMVKTRKAAEFLSQHKHDDGNYLQITDQMGKLIELPEDERMALSLALTLHEKGKSALKRKDYAEALLLLLEADKEFQKCRSAILQAVDNYALVCLDIVWCYLRLKNVDELPGAEIYLRTCEDCLTRSYGVNLERLIHLKGSVGEELALLVRLHLLQGILAYYQGHNDKAISLLNKANEECRSLEVDESKMMEVMGMGFSEREARLGLRACSGDVNGTVQYIMKRREEKKEIRAYEKEEQRKRMLAKKLGKTARGEDVNLTYYENLTEMGFSKGAAAAALRQTNNDVVAALQVLQNNPELLELPDPESPQFQITDEMISQLTSMGFDEVESRAALHHFQGKLEQCVEELLKTGGSVPEAWKQVLPSIYTDEDSSSQSADEEAMKNEALDLIAPDLPHGEEDHLDLDLSEEAELLQEYLALIKSVH